MCIRDRYQATKKQCYFELYDALGHQVYTTKLTQGQGTHELFITNIENGIYFYTIVEEGRGMDLGKVVIRK